MFKKSIQLNEQSQKQMTITISRSYSESLYLIYSNREKFILISKKKERTHNDTLEMLLSLHIILEVGLNAIFRRMALFKLKKNIKETELIENIDKINFIDKLILFIYNSSFNFGDKLEEATKYHKIIGILKSFAEIRNQIMHGHAIATVGDEDGDKSKYTKLRKTLSTDRALLSQIFKYIFIVDGVNFYLDSLEDNSLKFHIKEYKNKINYDFIPDHLLKRISVLKK